MTRIVPLNKETHKSLKVDARASAAYGDNQHFTHVIVKEFPLLVVHYPILFAKDANTGEFYCGVMLGFDQGENLFLEEWRDLEFYRPLGLQRVPFYAHGPGRGDRPGSSARRGRGRGGAVHRARAAHRATCSASSGPSRTLSPESRSRATSSPRCCS